MRNQRQRIGKQRTARKKRRVGFKIAIARQRPDPHLAAIILEVVQIMKEIEIDQHRRLRQAKVHRGQQALAAS